jgi:hypothetical protein
MIQDVSINDVNEVYKKLEIFSSILLLVFYGANAKSHFMKKTKLKISHGLK